MVEFLESILALNNICCIPTSHLLKSGCFFVFLIKKEIFLAEANSGLHKRIIFMNLFQF